MEPFNRDALISFRKEIITARQNWLNLIQFERENNLIWLKRRANIKFYKAEASNCLKFERAATQVIETIDGKRISPGELKGNKYGHLTYRVPIELETEIRFCAALGGLSQTWKD